MIKREMKGPADRVSLLGFGTMRLPTLPDGKIDRKTAGEMVDLAIKNGVNYFDTAYSYHDGESELFIGEALQTYPRGSFFLADKMPTWMLSTLADVKRVFAHQLEKCQVDYFDYYLCHSVGKNDRDFRDLYIEEGSLDYLRSLKAEGKIRHLGFSFHGNPDRLRAILAHGPWDFVQLQLNYLDWEIQDAKTLYAILEEAGIPCTVMEPVRGGALATLCPEALELLREADPDRSPASWALRFCASLPNVLTVLSGMSAPEQVADNLRTFTDFIPLGEADYQTIHQVVEAYSRTGAVPCTGCRYCIDCPVGVNIPEIFSIYNESAATLALPISFSFMRDVNVHGQTFLNRYRALDGSERAHNCISCGKCASVCPQGIAIPDRLKDIERLVSQLDR